MGFELTTLVVIGHTMISLPVDPRVISGEYSERGKSWIITDGETRGLIGVPGCNVD
jgi:hypothetical protein